MSNFATTIHSFVSTVISASSSSVREAKEITKYFQDDSVFGWLIGVFLAVSAVVTAVAAITGNLQGIIDFCQKNLRRFLQLDGCIPGNYALFLDHAVKHKFIQKVGGRYRFMHDLLRKHFAQMPLS